jgi:hypothetical protein
MDSSSPQIVAESRGGFSALSAALALGIFVLAWYFKDIGQVLPFLWNLFDTSAYPSPAPGQVLSVWGGSLSIFLAA